MENTEKPLNNKSNYVFHEKEKYYYYNVFLYYTFS